MKIYTKTGDKGETSLFGGDRVSKSNVRVEALGTIDELNAIVGVVRSLLKIDFVDKQLLKVQNDLFVLGSEAATPFSKLFLSSGKPRLEIMISKKDVQELESWIDELQDELQPLKYFILPAGNQAAASLHLARAVCRRAERIFVELRDQEELREEILKYINRLSDYLFVLARYVLKQSGVEEVYWNPKEV